MKFLILIFMPLTFLSCSSENVSNVDNENESVSLNDTHVEINYSNGKKLFQDSCSSCHGENRNVLAVPFQNIRKDYDLVWIVSFIRNNDSLIKSGDIRANYVFEIHNQSLMPNFSSLTDQQIIDILDYVDTFQILYNYYDHRKIPLTIMNDSIKAWKESDKKRMKETLKSIRKYGK